METLRSGARQRLRAEPSGSRRAGLSPAGTGTTGAPPQLSPTPAEPPPAAGPGRGQCPELPRPRRSRMEARKDGWREGWSGWSGGREQGPGTVEIPCAGRELNGVPLDKGSQAAFQAPGASRDLPFFV